jgi:hypothetical protein
MRQRLELFVAACVALVWLAQPGGAQGVGGLGAPTAQDTLENNLNALRGPSPGAPQRVAALTPQQSLDSNIGGLRSSGPIRNVPTPQYYPPTTARGPNHHPGADALLYGAGTTLAPVSGGHRRKALDARSRRRARP